MADLEEKKVTEETEEEMNFFNDDDVEEVQTNAEKTEDKPVEEKNKADSYNKNGDTTVTAVPIASQAVKKANEQKKKKRKARQEAVEKAEGNNVLKISGMVVNKYEKNGSGPVKLTIVVDNPNGRDADFPVVYAFRNRGDNTTIADDILAKDHVTVTGHASSYTRKASANEPGVFVQEIAADSIEKQKPTYPEKIGNSNGRPHYAYANVFRFNGRIMQISKLQNNVTTLSVRMEQDGHTNTINVTTFGHTADRLSVGQDVTLIGRITTQRKEYGDKNVRFFQNFVATRAYPAEDKKQGGKKDEAEKA